MTTVAIICEYNPFHNGHKYQIERVREALGSDVCIIAIMSGNYTQRADVAIADKSVRARGAVDEGANLVLELPFPYSMASAEFFAEAGVSIANSVRADYLAFGAEDGDIVTLEGYAELMLSESYSDRLTALENMGYEGYARLCEKAALELKDSLGLKEISFTPNNILALEYLKAIKRHGYEIKPLCIKREGAGYNEQDLVETSMQSASAIRTAIALGDSSAYDYVPNFSKRALLKGKEDGEFPCDITRLSPSIISFFRLNPPMADCDFQDAKGGLYNRIRENSFDTDNLNDLILLTETKRFTRARIRRAILFSYFGVTSSDVRLLPEYTQVLGLDELGRSKLKEIGKDNRLAILTKPSKTDGLSEIAKRQKELSDRADSLFQMTKPTFKSGRHSLKFTPYVKK